MKLNWIMRIIFSYLKDFQTIAAKKMYTVYFVLHVSILFMAFKEILVDDCQQKIILQ